MTKSTTIERRSFLRMLAGGGLALAFGTQAGSAALLSCPLSRGTGGSSLGECPLAKAGGAACLAAIIARAAADVPPQRGRPRRLASTGRCTARPTTKRRLARRIR